MRRGEAHVESGPLHLETTTLSLCPPVPASCIGYVRCRHCGMAKASIRSLSLSVSLPFALLSVCSYIIHIGREVQGVWHHGLAVLFRYSDKCTYTRSFICVLYIHITSLAHHVLTLVLWMFDFLHASNKICCISQHTFIAVIAIPYVRGSTPKQSDYPGRNISQIFLEIFSELLQTFSQIFCRFWDIDEKVGDFSEALDFYSFSELIPNSFFKFSAFSSSLFRFSLIFK